MIPAPVKDIAVIGCGGHARSIADVLIDNDPSVNLTFYDDNARENEKLLGKYPVLPISMMDVFGRSCFIAIGDSTERRRIAELLRGMNGINISVVSRHAYVSPSAKIMPGVFIADGAHIGPEAVIGMNTIINTGAVIEHESVVGEFSHVSVNASVCGRCVIGDNVFVGAGAVLRDGVGVCSDVIIGAGASVVKNIVESGVYAGVPASKIR